MVEELIPAAHLVTRSVSTVQHGGAILEIQGLSHHVSPSLAGSRAAESHPVLRSVDLRVHPSEIAVLLGPSGCGKSTLLSIASGLVPCQQGRVLVEGKLATGPHPRVGVVFQQPALLPWLNVGKNVAFGLSLRHSEPLSKRERLARVQEALEVVGLRVPLTMSPSHLSGGMAQKVALARVLVRRPRLLFLDEPFSALDVVHTSRELCHRVMSMKWLESHWSVIQAPACAHSPSPAEEPNAVRLAMGSWVKAPVENGP